MRYIVGIIFGLSLAVSVWSPPTSASIATSPPAPTPSYVPLASGTTIVARGGTIEYAAASQIAFPFALVGPAIPGTWRFGDVATIAEGPSEAITSEQVRAAVDHLRAELGPIRISATTGPAPTPQPHEYAAWMTVPVRGAPPTHAPYPPTVGLITVYAPPSRELDVIAAVKALRVAGASVVEMKPSVSSDERASASARALAKANGAADLLAARAAAVLGVKLRKPKSLRGPTYDGYDFADRPADWSAFPPRDLRVFGVVENQYPICASAGTACARMDRAVPKEITTTVSRNDGGQGWQSVGFTASKSDFTLVTSGTAQAVEAVPISYAIVVRSPSAAVAERAREVLANETGSRVQETQGAWGTVFLTAPAVPRDQNEVSRHQLLIAWSSIGAGGRTGIFRFASHCEALRRAALASALGLAADRAHAIDAVIGSGSVRYKAINLDNFRENALCASPRDFVNAAATGVLEEYSDDAPAVVSTTVTVAWTYAPKRGLHATASIVRPTPDAQPTAHPVFRYESAVETLVGTSTTRATGVVYRRSVPHGPDVEWLSGFDGRTAAGIIASLDSGTDATLVSNDQCRAGEDTAITRALRGLTSPPHFVRLLSFSSGDVWCNGYRPRAYLTARFAERYDETSVARFEVSK